MDKLVLLVLVFVLVLVLMLMSYVSFIAATSSHICEMIGQFYAAQA